MEWSIDRLSSEISVGIEVTDASGVVSELILLDDLMVEYSLYIAH